MGTNRHDFTYRTKLFGGFPKIERPRQGFNCEIGKKYSMEFVIEEDRAEYSIDGRLYAVCHFDAKDKVATEGYFGFAVYSPKELKRIYGITYTKLEYEDDSEEESEEDEKNAKVDKKKKKKAKKGKKGKGKKGSKKIKKHSKGGKKIKKPKKEKEDAKEEEEKDEEKLTEEAIK